MLILYLILAWHHQRWGGQPASDPDGLSMYPGRSISTTDLPTLTRLHECRFSEFLSLRCRPPSDSSSLSLYPMSGIVSPSESASGSYTSGEFCSWSDIIISSWTSASPSLLKPKKDDLLDSPSESGGGGTKTVRHTGKAVVPAALLAAFPMSSSVLHSSFSSESKPAISGPPSSSCICMRRRSSALFYKFSMVSGSSSESSSDDEVSAGLVLIGA